MKLIMLTIGALLLLVNCGFQPTKPAPSKDYFKRAIEIQEDPHTNVVTFSTLKGFQIAQGLYDTILDDNFLQGTLDKRTGKSAYRVYNVIYYTGPGNGLGWQNFYQVNYDPNQGNKILPVSLLKRQENCSSLEIYGKCVYNEHITFDLQETFLKQLLDSKTTAWEYYLIPKSGKVYTDQLYLSEVAALLEKMAEYALGQVDIVHFTPQTQSMAKLTPLPKLDTMF